MILRLVACLIFVLLPARALAAECLAVASHPTEPIIMPAAVTEGEVRIEYVGHSTFIIESPGGTRIATDYAGHAGGIVPDVVTMNHAHSSHYTDVPDPGITHVLRGWNPDGGPAVHDLVVGDVRIRNITTDIRGGEFGRQPDGNSIFVFEVGDLCIGHLGHLHHELTPGHLGLIGRLDVVMVPVDGGYTMAQVNMVNVLKELRAQVVLPMHFFTLSNLNRFVTTIGTEFKIERLFSRQVVLSQAKLPAAPSVYVLGE